MQIMQNTLTGSISGVMTVRVKCYRADSKCQHGNIIWIDNFVGELGDREIESIVPWLAVYKPSASLPSLSSSPKGSRGEEKESWEYRVKINSRKKRGRESSRKSRNCTAIEKTSWVQLCWCHLTSLLLSWLELTSSCHGSAEIRFRGEAADQNNTVKQTQIRLTNKHAWNARNTFAF